MKKKIIITISIIILSLIVFLGVRYNLAYGNSLKQKQMMVNCMYNSLEKHSFSKSKIFCECFIGTFVEQYGDDFLNPTKMFEIDNADEIRTACEKLLED